MRQICSILAAAVVVAAPAALAAQTPAGPVRQYAAQGCGDALASFNGAHPFVHDAVCVTGVVTLTPTAIDPAGTQASYDASYDLRVALAPTFQPRTLYFDNDGGAYLYEQFSLPTLSLIASVHSAYPPLAPGQIGLPGFLQFDYSYADSNIALDPNAVEFSLTFTATPEPSTVALTLGGLGVLGAGAWRRRRTA